MKLEIKKMAPEHVPQVAAIEAQLFSVPWSAQAFLDALSMEQAIFSAALADGNLAGYCGIYLAADEGEITNVAVAPAYRRCKVAQTLLHWTMAKVYERGVRRIFLEVRTSNAPAVKLYEKTGFLTVGRRKNFYQKPDEDALVMLYESVDNSIIW